MATVSATHDGPKGRPPLRQCPEDFDVIFVEQGRDGCESWYRASRKTVNRWMSERGAKRLIGARAAYVAHQRANGAWITRSTRLVEVRSPKRPPRLQAVRDRRKINPTVARHAAQYLRISRNDGRIVSQAPNGDWWVGSKRLSAAQMLDLATSKGFDAKAAEMSETWQSDAGDQRKFNRPDFNDDARTEFHKDVNKRLLYETPNAERRLGRLTDGE